MGLCGSSCLGTDWACDPQLAIVEALGKVFFADVGQQNRPWDAEAATLLTLLEQQRTGGPGSPAVVDRSWWDSRFASIDEEASKLIFDVMAVDAAGRQVNLYEVLSCAAALSPHLRKEWKLAILFSLHSCTEEGALTIDEVCNLFCCVLLGMHRLAILMHSPPKFEDIENDICRLLWILRKNQPHRDDAIAIEEALCLIEIDESMHYFFQAFGQADLRAHESQQASARGRSQGAADPGGAPRMGSSEQARRSGSKLDSKGPAMARAGSLNRMPVPASGRRQASRHREAAPAGKPQAPRRVPGSKEAPPPLPPKATPAEESSLPETAAPVSSVRASAVLSRREVLEAFDIYKEVCAEQDRMPRAGKRDSTALRSISKISNAQVQIGVKKLLAQGRQFALHDYLRILAVTKAPTAFTEGHMTVFKRWIVERADLTDSELLKYGLEKASTERSAPQASQSRPTGRGNDKLAASSAGVIRRRMQVLSQRVHAQRCQAWIARLKTALAHPKGIAKPQKKLYSELRLSLEDMVTQGVMPDALATAAARTFGWDASLEVSEGSFLELLVPVPRDDYHSLDFMGAFRRAWLQVNNNSAEPMASPSEPSGEEGGPSWMFKDNQEHGTSVAAQREQEAFRPHSAPPAPNARSGQLPPLKHLPPLPQPVQASSKAGMCTKVQGDPTPTSQYDDDTFECASDGSASPKAEGQMGYEDLVQMRSTTTSAASSFVAGHKSPTSGRG